MRQASVGLLPCWFRYDVRRYRALPQKFSGKRNCRDRGLRMRAGADMDRGSAESGHLLSELVLDLVHDGVCFGNRETPVDGDMEIGMHAVAEPARPHLMDPLDALDVERGALDFGQDGRLDPVQHAQEDRAGGVLDDEEDRHRDHQPDERIEHWHADPDADRADEHGEGGKAIDSRVLSVGNEGRRPDLLANPDTKNGHRFVPYEADDSCSGDPPQVGNGLWIDQLPDRLVASDTG
ncbi:MAG: hypothetical protein K0S14_549 [Thermomicrobiales bacterium]|nr:hypothetical protein [Thermomicrobiales bacterium]